MPRTGRRSRRRCPRWHRARWSRRSGARVEASIGLPGVPRVVAQDAAAVGALALDHGLPRQEGVGEVVRRGHAVGEEVERSVQRRPVDLIGRGVVEDAEHRGAPAVERLVDAEAARAAREEVAVARHEAGGHELAVDVEDLVGGDARVGVAGADRGDASVLHEHVSALDVAGVVGARGDRDETCVRDQERHVDDGNNGVFPRCSGRAASGLREASAPFWRCMSAPPQHLVPLLAVHVPQNAGHTPPHPPQVGQGSAAQRHPRTPSHL